MSLNPAQLQAKFDAARFDAARFDAQEALYYRAVLRTLIDVGTKMAVDIAADAAAAREAGTPKPELTIPVDCIVRAVRRCILLARKLAEPLKKAT